MKKTLLTKTISRCSRLLLIGGLSLFHGGAQAGELHEELEKKAFLHDGLKRTYYLHLPFGYESYDSLPIVLILHGGGEGDGDEVARQTGYNTISDREGFIAVYPNGVDAQWNDGRETTSGQFSGNQEVDDVGFLSRLIDHLITRYNGDPTRVYATGLSNGGMMTLRLGCETSSQLAAIAPVIANLPKPLARECTPDSPLAVLVMNGTDDPVVPWKGGPVTIFGSSHGEVISTARTVGLWVSHNQCDPIPEVELLPDTDPTDGCRVKVRRYRSIYNACEVILYGIEGGGHNFPGSSTPNWPRVLGNKNNDIVGSEVIWEFFSRHTKNY